MIASSTHGRVTSRWRWTVRGQVQGVGFRPAVHRLATDRGLTGFVRNEFTEVVIEAQGPGCQLENFERALQECLPPLAQIQEVTRFLLEPLSDDRDFRIETSTKARRCPAHVTPDAAVCTDCVRETLDPQNRRYGHALISCAHCGPRFSVIESTPYDRCNTTLAGFSLCDPCRTEYTDPSDRRFHAQTIACHDCGPALSLVDASGRTMAGDPMGKTVRLLNAGKIVAIKGGGGFHLAVRADDEHAVGRLRRLKQRDARPFAIMAPSIRIARGLVRLSDAAVDLMQGPISPIVLAPRCADVASIGHHPIATNVAPNNHRLGVMLPNTPIQHLFYACRTPRLSPEILIMTSGNVSDEPLVIDNQEAVSRLGPICDAILWHDRPIRRRVDDSVLLDMGDVGGLLPVRRARGLSPAPIELPMRVDRPGLCVGGELKNTVAIVDGSSVVLSPHIGDLKDVATFEHFQRCVDDLLELLDVEPAWVAHDLHPASLSTQLAGQLARTLSIERFAIQHHHAHAAALLAEHGVTKSAIAIVCDGVGYGDGGQIWGGEILFTDLCSYRRLGSLMPMRLPGGDAAARETARCGLALLYASLGSDFGEHPIVRRLSLEPDRRDAFVAMIQRDLSCAHSSAAGRVFDGVAALLGICDRNRFEAEAPIALEAAAAGVDSRVNKPLFDIRAGAIERLDLSRLIRHLIENRLAGEPAAQLAALFHDQFAWGLAELAVRGMQACQADIVTLTGGVFCNERLTQQVSSRIAAAGGRALTHRIVPASDGGLAYGQAAVAAATMARRNCSVPLIMADRFIG